MRIAFLGTPEFSIPSLRMLIRGGHTLAVFTQPDRPVGRHAVLTPPPVKVIAAENGIPVYQFERIRRPEGVSALRTFSPDLMVTAAFGQILSQENLDIPPFGCINVHGSLLPKYRGAAPIQWSIIDGCLETGVTTMLTNAGMDTGDILMKRSVNIGPEETAGELSQRLSVLGAELLQETIRVLMEGTLTSTPQDESQATKCPLLKKEHGKLDFHQSASMVHNRVRGTNPWPGAYALLDEAPLKIWSAKLAGTDMRYDLEPGSLIEFKGRLYAICGVDSIEILSLQAVGGKRMNTGDFLRGRSLSGKVLL